MHLLHRMVLESNFWARQLITVASSLASHSLYMSTKGNKEIVFIKRERIAVEPQSFFIPADDHNYQEDLESS